MSAVVAALAFAHQLGYIGSDSPDVASTTVAPVPTKEPQEIFILSPINGGQVFVQPFSSEAPWTGTFSVIGGSKNVETGSDSRIYVLSRRHNPPLPDWVIRGPEDIAEGNLAEEGEWLWEIVVADGWRESPAREGIEIELIAIVADPSNIVPGNLVANPNELNPSAMSEIVRVSISGCHPECATPTA